MELIKIYFYVFNAGIFVYDKNKYLLPNLKPNEKVIV